VGANGARPYGRTRHIAFALHELFALLAGGVASAPRFSAEPVCAIMERSSLPARRPYAGRGRAGAPSAWRRTRTGRFDFVLLVSLSLPGWRNR